MTKEQAIDIIKCLAWHARPDEEQIEQAIKALEQQPSNDCVSRQAVIEAIDDCNSDGLKGIFCSYDDGERFKEYIKKLPPVTPTQRWIPVSERLPKEGKEVLVYYEYFRYGDYNCMQTTYGVGYQYDGLWCGDVRGHKLNVIAWQPLPKPYEEKRGNSDGSN